MNKEEIKKASREKYPFPDGKIDFKIAIKRMDFEEGVEWAAEQMFTKEDMQAAYSAGAEDEYTWRTFNEWIKEREKK